MSVSRLHSFVQLQASLLAVQALHWPYRTFGRDAVRKLQGGVVGDAHVSGP